METVLKLKKDTDVVEALRVEEIDKLSFSAANTYPLKLMLHEDLIHSCLHGKRVPPMHVQLNPTNKCNFKCSFCSCSSRDRKLELSFEEIAKFMGKARRLGCKSVTITGGGEPTMHRHFNKIITAVDDLGIETGLVTNGSLFHRVSDTAFGRMTWIRISASDVLPIQLKRIGSDFNSWLKSLSKTVRDHSLDWAFSYVVTEHTRPELVASLVDFAKEHNFTHVRLVNDIFNADRLRNHIGTVKRFLAENRVDDYRVNYQDRGTWTRGSNPCYISLLKPVIGADGYVYPCCGTQYALANPTRDYEKAMRMGHIRNFEELYEKQSFFNGDICRKCYYTGYNEMLSVMLNGLKHANFV